MDTGVPLAKELNTKLRHLFNSSKLKVMKKNVNKVAAKAFLATSKPSAANAASTSMVDQFIHEQGLDVKALRQEAYDVEYFRMAGEACRKLIDSVESHYVDFSHWVDEMDSYAIEEANKAIIKWHAENLERRKALRRLLERWGASKEYISEELSALVAEEQQQEDSRWHYAYKIAFALLQSEDATDGWKDFVLLHWTEKALLKGRKNPMAVKNYLLDNARRIGKELGLTTLETKASLTNQEVKRLLKILK